MPNVGDIAKGKDIGTYNGVFIYLSCSKCKETHWVSIAWHKKLIEIDKPYACHQCGQTNKPLYQHTGTIENPNIGDVRHAKELGKVNSQAYYLWAGCIDCGKPRWTLMNKGKPNRKRCSKCSGIYNVRNRIGEKSNFWKGGVITDGDGYKSIRLLKDDFFYLMADKHHYVKIHRLTMAKHLGRCLHAWEIVHHKNGDKVDNRIENLELKTRQGHVTDHCKGYKDGYKNGYLDGKSKHISELESHNKELTQKLKFLEWVLSEKYGVISYGK